jgi:hypothetical protein
LLSSGLLLENFRGCIIFEETPNLLVLHDGQILLFMAAVFDQLNAKRFCHVDLGLFHKDKGYLIQFNLRIP